MVEPARAAGKRAITAPAARGSADRRS